MATKAKLTPDVLAWAIRRAGLSEDMLARKLGTSPERVIDWLEGRAQPTFNQAQRAAKALSIPFGFLFLTKPPEEEFPLPDLRTVRNQPVQEPSPELRDIVRQVLQKQAWYIDYLKDHDRERLDFVGSFTADSPVDSVVLDIRNRLNVPRPRSGSWDEYQRSLIKAAERIGILVMRAGIVGVNTHRKLNVDEFRGFAIADSLAPVVFINSSDAPNARLFTLIHELGHIWIGSSGVSSITTQEKNKEEAFCNEVAGEFLVPRQELFGAWDEQKEWRLNIAELATVFHVSKLVVARRAEASNLISTKDYQDYYLEEIRAYKNKESSGGSFYMNAGVRNSQPFSRAVVAEALRGGMLLRDAGALLNIPPNKIKTYAGELNS